MRWAEIALFLTPPLLLLLWWAGGRRASWRLLGAALAAVGALAVLLVVLGLHRAVPGRYVPAHLENGRVVPGHGQ